MPEYANEEKAIFLAALEQASVQEREAYLRGACGGDVDLLKRVKVLLSVHEDSQGPLDAPSPGVGIAPPVDEPLTERPGAVIGPYKLLEQIGEGGFGIVFMAEQQHPVRRKVALKVIKPGMDSAQVIARFEAERQALAIMDHLNIARVFDAGATATGRPYFVMELVHGVPITRYCDDNRLTPRERLELFIPVCQAIQHAHQKGIIHRDIKPSNVMVCLYDGTPVPKVIDFGVAKAIEQRLTERTLFTQYGTIVGTFEYMAPEQAELSQLSVDTRSDLYALGVLLYELLTGSTPLEHKRLQEAAYQEIVRLIKEEEPPRPSRRLSSSGAALATISQQRRTEPAKLTKLVRGELDWIVMKCLEKDRTRRYETASSLARDLQHYLADEPVEACPPSAGYRLRKLARKYRKPLAAAVAFAVLLIAGTVLSAWQAVRATRAEAVAGAEKANAQAALRFLMAEVLQADPYQEPDRDLKVRTLLVLLAEVLEQADPYQEPGRDLKVRTLLDRAVGRLEGNTQMPPLVQAAIRQAMGRSYWSLGEIEMAERHLTQASALYRQHAGEDDDDALATAYHLARLYLFQSAFSKAEPLALRVLDGRRRLLGDSHPETLLAMYLLGVLYHFKDEPERAELFFAKALEASLPRGDRDLTRLRIMGGFGHLYVTLGRYDEAERLFDKAQTGSKTVVGEKSPYNLIGKSILATLYLKTSRLAAAEQQASESYRGWRTVSERNGHTLWSQGILAWVYLAQGRRSDAEPLLREFREKADRQQDRLPPFDIWTIGDLGSALLDERDFSQAESFLRFYVAVAAKKLPDGWRRSAAVSALGACLLGQKKYAEAEPLLLKGYAGLRQYEARIPARFRRLRLTEALERLVQLYVELGKPDEATKWRKELEAPKADAKPAAGSGKG